MAKKYLVNKLFNNDQIIYCEQMYILGLCFACRPQSGHSDSYWRLSTGLQKGHV